MPVVSVESPSSLSCEKEASDNRAALIFLLKAMRLISGSACFSCEINSLWQPCPSVSHRIATEMTNLAVAAVRAPLESWGATSSPGSALLGSGAGLYYFCVPQIMAFTTRNLETFLVFRYGGFEVLFRFCWGKGEVPFWAHFSTEVLFWAYINELSSGQGGRAGRGFWNWDKVPLTTTPKSSVSQPQQRLFLCELCWVKNHWFLLQLLPT